MIGKLVFLTLACHAWYVAGTVSRKTTGACAVFRTIALGAALRAAKPIARRQKYFDGQGKTAPAHLFMLCVTSLSR